MKYYCTFKLTIYTSNKSVHIYLVDSLHNIPTFVQYSVKFGKVKSNFISFHKSDIILEIKTRWEIVKFAVSWGTNDIKSEKLSILI